MKKVLAHRTRSATKRRAALLVLVAGILTTACGPASSRETLTVFNAGSLARPLRAALDSFSRREGITFDQESAGSLETARKLTELGKIPDLVALADVEVIPTFLMPSHATWYATFARNRMVVAFTDRSEYAAEVTPDTWWEVLTREGVEVGRSDPDLDPNGYRTLLVWQLAEQFYGRPGLASRLLAHAPARNVRPNEAALVALLEAGEMDYIWSYASMAERSGFRYVQLPVAIDLSSSADSAAYAKASVRVAGKTFGDSITIQGRPIRYALTIPTAAPHPDLARRFVAWLASADGQRVLRAEKLDVLDRYVVVGTGAPALIP